MKRIIVYVLVVVVQQFDDEGNPSFHVFVDAVYTTRTASTAVFVDRAAVYTTKMEMDICARAWDTRSKLSAIQNLRFIMDPTLPQLLLLHSVFLSCYYYIYISEILDARASALHKVLDGP